MGRALTVENVLNAKFKELAFTGEWEQACGLPELGGNTWFIYGDSKMGKTTFAMMFGKMLTQFGKVIYDSIEEGLSKSVKMAYKRVNMKEVNGQFHLLDKEELQDNEHEKGLITRLQKRKSPPFIFIDSIQFAEMTFADYKRLKLMFPDKNIIYISHVKGRKPDGSVAMRIWRDASLSFYIEGFKAFPTSRYGSDQNPLIINQELADKYWGLKNLK